MNAKHDKRPEHRRVCDCGNLATVKQGGRSIWICERCAKLEREAYYQNAQTQARIRKTKETPDEMCWHMYNRFAFIK